MASWLIFAASCVGFWGIWGFVAKLTTMRGVHPLALSAVSSITAGLTAWATFYVIGAPWEKNGGSILLALLTGICGSAGAIAFFLALQRGRASLVVPLSALYPAVTILLSLIFLGERPTLTQALGMLLALIASLLLGM